MIVFFDIDGTLVTDGTDVVIPQSAVTAIRRARANGHLMYINTGRTYGNVEQKIRDIGFDGYICGCGTHIVCGKNTLLKYTVDPETAMEMIELAHRCDITAVFEHPDRLLLDSRARDLNGLLKLKESFDNQGKGDSFKFLDKSNFRFSKLVAWYDEKSDLEGFRAGTQKKFDFIDRGCGFLELAVKGYSKGRAIHMVCDYHNIAIDNAVAIGDSLNDLPMLTAVRRGVAMGNSVESLKAKADFVTKNIDDNGIEAALRHYGLLSNQN